MNRSMNIRCLIPALAMALVAAGCGGEQERKLDRLVDDTNAACPIEINDAIAVEKVSRSGSYVVYDVKVDDGLSVKALKDNAEVARKLVSDAIAGSDSPDVRAELETCRDAGATMKYVLADGTGETFTIEIDPADYLK